MFPSGQPPASVPPVAGDSYPPFETRQLPSLRTVVNPSILSSRPSVPADNSTTRLLSFGGFEHASERPIHRLSYPFREESQPSVPASRPTPVAAPAYPFASTPSTAPSAPATFRTQQSLNEPIYASHLPESIPSGAMSSDHQSSNGDVTETTELMTRRRNGDVLKGTVRAANCVGQQEVPGEGLCFVYDDGTYCRTIIDGEAVNPAWGVTKAGKPRKRLAQACLTCREKKIKCEPGVPKCSQCTRARRTCRGGMNSQNSGADVLGVDLAEIMLPMRQRSGDLSDTRLSPAQKGQSTSLSPDGLAGASYGLISESSRKRLRRGSSDERREVAQSFAAAGPRMSELMPTGGSAIILQGWQQDPYEADPVLTMKLLNLYFSYVNSTTYAIFPREAFTVWATNGRQKSTDDKLVIYAVLCMGSVFSTELGQRGLEKEMVDIVTGGLQKRVGKFSLQLCQSRLLLALYYFARGRHEEAWDWCGSGLRALSALKLNTEEGATRSTDDGDREFDFNQVTLEECRRRTFWAGFLMDRFNGHSGGTLFMIGLEDTFLRLPCNKATYESCQPAKTPVFDNGTIDGDTSMMKNVGGMGHLALVSAIWGEVWSFTTRAARRAKPTSLSDYEVFYNRINDRLESWLANLPSELQFSEPNLDKAILNGSAGTLVSLHALYNATHIRLNRHARHAALPVDTVKHNIVCANLAARRLLSLMVPLAPDARQARLGAALPPDFTFSTPFPGYAIMLAVDVLSAGGAVLPDVPLVIKALTAGLAVVDEIALYWTSAKQQQKAVAARLRGISEAAMGERAWQAGSWAEWGGVEFWRLEKPLETVFERQDDILYGVQDEVLFDALMEVHVRVEAMEVRDGAVVVDG